MPLQIQRLSLATLRGLDGGTWPVHGFVVTYPGGALLVDTGVGGPQQWLADWRVVNRSVADALDELGMTPGDIGLVINTHLHFDHCGQNAVFKNAAFYVQRRELDRARRESPQLADWFDFMGARFELLDGDTEILPGLSVIATPGHTVGHQSVVVRTADTGEPGDGGEDLLIGDAAYTPRQYREPERDDLPDGQASDLDAWRASVRRIRSAGPGRVHFCHSTDIVHS
ncbi:MAG TPA: N-acyl homoserine lactonase family protein [Streptosporangiaceae bacterium]|nr:N-acyl homoserine lactonase family protein [Streptosporangiaceae bacterium]